MSEQARPASILGVGARASPGLSARQVATGVAAGRGLSRTVQLPEASIVVMETVGLANATTLPERLLQLAVPALREAVWGIPRGPWPLVLAVPERPAAASLGFDARALLDSLCDAAPCGLDRSRSSIVAGEHAAGALAMTRALELVRGAQGPNVVVVGGVDSRVLPEILEELMAAGRLSPATFLGRDYPDRGGQLPGEGAAFLALGRDGVGTPMARLSSVGARVVSGGASGVAAIHGLLRGAIVDDDEALWLMSDINGEPGATGIWTEALRELQAERKGARLRVHHETPALSFGDVGAAIAPLSVALASVRLASGAPPDLDTALVVVRARDGLAGAVSVHRADHVAAMPGAARRPVPERPLRVARVGLREVERWATELRAVAHRFARPRRTPVFTAIASLVAALSNIEDAESADAVVVGVASMEKASADLDVATKALKRSMARRGHGQEPALDRLEALAIRLVKESHVLKEIVAVAAAQESATQGVAHASTAPFVASRARPAPLHLGYARTSASAESIEDAGEAEEPGDEEAGDEEGGDDLALTGPREVEPVTERPAAGAELEATAEDVLDTIALLWRVRQPPEGAPWSPRLLETDARILAELDHLHALASPGPGREPKDARLDAAPTLRAPDDPLLPGVAFARGLVLASCAEERWTRLAAGRARSAPSTLERAYVDALALGASAAAPEIAAELCREPSSSAVRVGLSVMVRRRSVSLGAVVPHLYHREPALRRLAARALGFVKAKENAVVALETRLALERSPAVVAAAIESLARLRAPHTVAHIRRAITDWGSSTVGEERAAVLEVTAVAAALGRSEEAAVCAAAERPEEIELLGWFGRVLSVHTLLERLEASRGAPEVHRATARALQRILGVVYEPSAKGHAAVRAELVATDEDRLVLDASLVRAYWDAHGEAFGVRTRYRFGAAYDVRQSLAEVGAVARQADRERAELEFALQGPPGAMLCDPSDWVGAQLATLRLAQGAP